MSRVDHDVPLAPRTTLGLGGAARRLVTLERIEDVRDVLALAGGEPILVLGGGSNLVVRDGGFDGLVIQMAIPGIRWERDAATGEDVVTVGAGVVWDELVAQLVAEGRRGVECMSGIPGLVGATPMQNVGAYGQEVADTIRGVRVLDRATDRIETLRPADCAFAYRSSIFRGSDRWLVLEVSFAIARAPGGDDGDAGDSMPIAYPELAKALDVGVGGTAPLARVRETVLRLRAGKGMVVDARDPESRSAGSFFTNPIVDDDAVAALEARVPAGTQIPRWPAGEGKTKLSAGWLIERAGFARGYTRGRARISHKHALALVNAGGASAGELLALAHEIQAGVRDRLGIELHPEPIIVGRE